MPTQATVSARRGFLGAQSRRHSRIALANSRPICVRLDGVGNSLGCAARIQRRLIICFHALLTHVLSVITPGMTSGRGRGRDQLRRECEGMTRLLLLWAARGFPSASSYLAWRVGRLDLWRIHSRLMGGRLAFLLSVIAQRCRRSGWAVDWLQNKLRRPARSLVPEQPSDENRYAR
jgi:hypothetical protein